MAVGLSRASLAALGLTVAGAMPAVALEPQAVTKALEAALTAGSHITAAHDSVRSEGGDVVIEGLAIAHTSDDQMLRFDKVVVKSPAKQAGAAFRSPEIDFTGGTISGQSEGVVATATLTNATVFEASERRDIFGGSILFDTAEAAGVRVSAPEDRGDLAIDHVKVTMANVVGDIALDSTGTIDNMTVPATLIRLGRFMPAAFGIPPLAVDVHWDGTRDPKAGTMTIRSLSIAAHDGSGTLSVAGTFGNLPDPRIINDDSVVDKAARSEVHQLVLRYDDNALAGRILDTVATRQGMTREEYVGQLSAALPFLLLTIKDPPFQTALATAIGSFLSNPHSLSVTLAPDTPVSGAEIVHMLRSTPEDVAARLKASVTANAPP